MRLTETCSIGAIPESVFQVEAAVACNAAGRVVLIIWVVATEGTVLNGQLRAHYSHK